MEDLWLTTTLQRHSESLEIELRVKAVGELPAEHVPGEQIHDRHQVEEPFLRGDVSDVGGPHQIRSRDCAAIDEAGKALRWLTGSRGAWLLVNRSSTHTAHDA